MDIEAELRKIMPEEELEHLSKEKIKSFHGFLTREVALRLIAKEKGLLREEEREIRLAEIPKGAKNVSFQATVGKVWPVASYSSGKRSRVVEVSDESGERPLILWNEDVEIAAKVKKGDRIRVRNAYEKGGELHLGYSGDLGIVEKAPFPPLSEIADGGHVHARGVVARIEGYDTFIREGRAQRGFAFIISDGQTERRCVIIGGLDRAAGIKEADMVRIENAPAETGNLYIEAESRIMVRPSGLVIGNVDALDCTDEKLTLVLGGKEFVMGRDEALFALRLKVSDDIRLSTVVGLKKDKLLNTRLALHIQDGRVVVRG